MHINHGMLAALKGFFGVGRTRRSGNRALSSQMQKEIKELALAKRNRKMRRPIGWYNG